MAETNEGGWILSDAALAKVVKAVRRILGRSLTQRDDRSAGLDTGPVNWVTYKNVSGETVLPYSVLAPTTAFTVIRESTAAGASIVSIVPHMTKPTTVYNPRFAIAGSQPTTNGGTGLCTYEGPCIQRCSTAATPAMGDGYGPKPGSFEMFPGYPRTTYVDGVVSSTGKLVMGSLDAISVMKGKTNGAVTGGTASTAYRIYSGVQGSETDAGLSVPPALSQINISSSKWIKLTPCNNGLIMEPLECST
jgi:hypothetical protein